MSFSRTQIEMNLQCSTELMGRLIAEKGFLGREWHKHPFFEVFYIAKGEFEVMLAGRTERVGTGDTFLVAPNVHHQFISESGGELLYVGISLHTDASAVYRDFIRWNDSSLTELFRQTCSLTEKKGVDALRKSVKGLMPALCSVVLSLHPKGYEETADALSQKIMNYLSLHLGENITMKEIADALYMNPHYLGEYFKKKNGISIKNYLLQLRMQKAFAMLKEGKQSVSQIAKSVGFDTVQYFSTKFKEYYGASPGKYFENLNLEEK